jgi:hypothetical protein
MAEMRTNREGWLKDAQGRLVPIELVKPEHLLEDDLVHALHAKALVISEQLRHFREESIADILALLDILAEKYGTQRGGHRGNITLNTYDGALRVLLATGDQIELGPELQIAKDLVDSCIRRWSEGASIQLKAIVDLAFDVDKKGKLNTDRILALRRLDIQDPEWQRAMIAIGDAVRVVSSKRYLRLYTRKGDEKYTQVPLDVASA